MLKNNKKMNSESFVAAREKSNFKSTGLNKMNSDVWFRKQRTIIKKLNEGKTTNKTIIHF